MYARRCTPSVLAVGFNRPKSIAPLLRHVQLQLFGSLLNGLPEFWARLIMTMRLSKFLCMVSINAWYHAVGSQSLTLVRCNVAHRCMSAAGFGPRACMHMACTLSIISRNSAGSHTNAINMAHRNLVSLLHTAVAAAQDITTGQCCKSPGIAL
jgi:hypothetical protein